MPAPSPAWGPPPDHLELAPNQVHLWRASLDLPSTRVQALAPLLSAAEAERAARFKFPEHRRRYVVAHAALRLILSRYLDASTSSIDFGYAQQMKPYIPDSDLCFNLSHSHELALLALARGPRIGVDLEFNRPLSDFDQMAARYFAASEHKTYQGLPEAAKAEGFYNCWTRKEAFVKAIGDGLTYPLDRFEVTLAPGQPARLLALHDAPGQLPRWTLAAFTPQPNYTGALAVEVEEVEISYWEAGDMLLTSNIE